MGVAILLTAIASVLFYFSFPNILSHHGFPLLSWLCLIPLFFALEKRTVMQRLELGVVFGLLSYGLLVQWLIPLNWMGWLLFVFVLMIQPVLFCVLSCVGTRSQWLNAVVIAGLWVGLEYFRSLLLGDFVFGLGYSQSGWPVMIQTAEWAGVYGISFVIVLINYLLYATLTTRGARRQYALGALIIVGVLLGHGMSRMLYIQHHSFGQSLTIGVAQANIDPEQKLDLKQYDHNIMEHMRLTKQAAMHDTDLVIWPETALVDDYFQDAKWQLLIRRMIYNLETWLIIGTATLEHGQDFNSALLLDGYGDVQHIYHKRFLVPFTEYLPQQQPFQLLKEQFELTGFHFEKGTQLGLAYVRTRKGDRVPFGLAICSETGYAKLYRLLALSGARFFVSMLNDGWFKHKAALMMHWQQDVFRSVENRLPVVRSANTGVSGYIDQRGVMKKKDRLPLMERAYGVFRVQSYHLAATPYALLGDVFAQLCMMLSFVFISFFIFFKLIQSIFKGRE